ncbi:MAG: hypothetical protein ACK5IC_03170 [Moheibacter sp.]
MRNIKIILLGLVLIFNLNCSKTQEVTPSEQSIVSAGTDDKVLIRLKPNVGDSQKIAMIMDMSSEGQQAISMDMNAQMNLKVSAKEETVYTYDVSYNSMKLNMNMGAMEISYNSEDKEHEGTAAMLHNQMKVLLENTISLKMDEMGFVSDILLPGNITAEQAGDMNSLSIPLPKEPVGEGDTWTAERPMQGMGVMKMNMEVEKVTVDDVIIKTTGEMVDTAGTSIGTFDGNYTLDRDNGLTKDGTMNMNISVEKQKINMKINFKSI